MIALSSRPRFQDSVSLTDFHIVIMSKILRRYSSIRMIRNIISIAAATYFSPGSGSFTTFSANCIFASARLCSMPENPASGAFGNASSSFLSNQINWHVLHRSRLIRRSSRRLANSLKAFPQLGQLLSDGVLSATAVRQS